MREILNLAATLIEASGNAPSRHASAASAMLVMVATAVASLCAIGAAVCLLTALWLYEMPLLGEVGAPLLVAAVLAAAALIAGLILGTKTSTPAPAPPGPLAGGLALHEALAALMRSHKSLVLIGALVAGLVAGEKEGR